METIHESRTKAIETFRAMGYSLAQAEAMVRGSNAPDPEAVRENLVQSFEDGGAAPEVARLMADGRGGLLLTAEERSEADLMGPAQRIIYEAMRTFGHPHEVAVVAALGRQ